MCLNALNSFVWVAMPPPCGLESSTYIRPNKVYTVKQLETSVSFKQWLFFTFFQCRWPFAAVIQFDEVLMLNRLRCLVSRKESVEKLEKRRSSVGSVDSLKDIPQKMVNHGGG